MENTIKELKQLKDMTCGYEESLDKAIAATEKQIAKKPFGDLHSVPHFRCPNEDCFVAVKAFEDSQKEPYCHRCGQKIDWSNYES